MDGASSTRQRHDRELKWETDGVEEEVTGRSCVCGGMTLAVSGTSSGSPFPLSSRKWHVLEEPSLK